VAHRAPSDAGRGGRTFWCLPDSETSVRASTSHRGAGVGYAIAELALQDLAFCASPEAFFQTIARAAPRGDFPRGMSGEQSYWTVVGVDGVRTRRCFLRTERSSLAVDDSRSSPFVRMDSGLLTWADVEIEHSLQESSSPPALEICG